MKNKRFLIATALGILSAGFSGNPALAQSGLQVTFGAKGVQTISYQGTMLEDVGRFPADAFHIWHTKLTDLKGHVLGGGDGQYGWGEINNGESWDSGSNTETYHYMWGTIAVRFAQSGSNLDMTVTETNDAGSGVILDGAEIYPFELHFPIDPKGFSGYTQYAITTIEPGVSVADYGSGVVTSVLPNESLPLYGGWKVNGAATYSPIMTTTAPDGQATFLPRKDVPVMPGASLSYTVSLRFTPEGTAASAADAYASFAAMYPSQMTWSDRRAIGTAYLASSPSGSEDSTQPGGFPTNPRRYFNDPTIDITSAAGLQAFQIRMLAQAASNAVNAQAMEGQGVITWDIEGEQFPQSTSYVCSPDQIATVAPEMESTIMVRGSAFYGQKLDDAYFKTMENAGLKIGLCLRPQVFTMAPNGRASQVDLGSSAAIIANLENKAKFANSRWGATIFYVDSTVDRNGGTLDPAIFEQMITDLPGFLFIPEESTPRYYAYSAPFYSFLFHTTVGTPASVYEAYPQAFGVNLVNDVAAATLATYQPQLTAAVAKGDILMGHADYWQDNDPTIVSIYRAAGVGAPVAPAPITPEPMIPPPPAAPVTPDPTIPVPTAPAPAPVTPEPTAPIPTTPVPTAPAPTAPAPTAPAPDPNSPLAILSPSAGNTVSGTIAVAAQVRLALDAAGSYLVVDGMEVGTGRVGGAPYLYPLDTTMLSNGNHLLQIWAHDIGNHTVLSETVAITVSN